MGELVKRSTDREAKINKMVADSQVEIGQRLRLVTEQSKHARLQVHRRALSQVQRAMDTLVAIMDDKDAPAQTRRLAALDILGLGGAVPNHDSGAMFLTGRPVYEMTVDELRGIVAEQKQHLADLEGAVIDGEVVAV